MYKYKIILSCILLMISLSSSGIAPVNNTYSNSKRLFHIERSANKNIVCYDLNTNEKGILDTKEPIQVYWINREEHPGKHGVIKFFQQPAYGYKVASINNNTVLIKLNAVKTRPVSIEKNENNQYICKTNINGHVAILQKIYVKTYESNSLKVEYVDIFGKLPETDAIVTERIKQ